MVCGSLGILCRQLNEVSKSAVQEVFWLVRESVRTGSDQGAWGNVRTGSDQGSLKNVRTGSSQGSLEKR